MDFRICGTSFINYFVNVGWQGVWKRHVNQLIDKIVGVRNEKEIRIPILTKATSSVLDNIVQEEKKNSKTNKCLNLTKDKTSKVIVNKLMRRLIIN